MIASDFAGFLSSRYPAADQLGFVEGAWDAFFGRSSERVLDSAVSDMWPLSDAALGTFAYTFEFQRGFTGAPSRWRTMVGLAVSALAIRRGPMKESYGSWDP